MANEKPVRYYTDAINKDSFGFYNGCCVGENFGGYGGGDNSGAMRFTNIDIGNNESINMARLVYKSISNPAGSGRWKVKLSGIAEDNTGSFGDPFGRPKTSNYETIDADKPTTSTVIDWSVTSTVQEIVNRSGWSRNNAMGFIFEDNGSGDQVWAFASPSESYLVYRILAAPNFAPTPISVSAPALPTPEDYGIKISRPGFDVRTAQDADLFYTSAKYRFKVVSEGQTTTNAATFNIPHGLGYTPYAEVFAKSGDRWFKLPFANYSLGLNIGYCEVDSTNLIVNAGTSRVIYYYIFIDELV